MTMKTGGSLVIALWQDIKGFEQFLGLSFKQDAETSQNQLRSPFQGRVISTYKREIPGPFSGHAWPLGEGFRVQRGCRKSKNLGGRSARGFAPGRPIRLFSVSGRAQTSVGVVF